MSGYSGGTASFNPVGACLAVVGAMATAVNEHMTSAVIAAFAAPDPLLDPVVVRHADRIHGGRLMSVSATTALARAEERRGLVERSAPVRALLAEATPLTLARSATILADARVAAASGQLVLADQLAVQADMVLVAGISQTAGWVAGKERHIAATAIQVAASRLGYAVETVHGSTVTGVVVRRREHVVAWAIEDGARLELDVLGAGGDACLPVVEELQQALAEDGMVIRTTRSRRHGAVEGGPLIAEAASAAAGGSLAAGIVAAREGAALRRAAAGQRSAASLAARQRSA